MKPLRLGRWGSQFRPLGTVQCSPPLRLQCCYSIRYQSGEATKAETDEKPIKRKRGRPRKNELAPKLSSVTLPSASTPASPSVEIPPERIQSSSPNENLDPSQIHSSHQIESLSTLPESRDALSVSLEELPSPPVSAARSSAKLAALYSRLSLPTQLPLETLARALVHPSADSDPRFNNASLALLGNDLLGYYMGEHLLCHFPRLPMAVLFAAQYAYVGPRALAALTHEWGVEIAAEPGGEVDPGLLQFKRMAPGTVLGDPGKGTRPDQFVKYRRGMTSRVVYDDQFGDIRLPTLESTPTASPAQPDFEAKEASVEDAGCSFARALFGAIYLHSGAQTAHTFFSNHILTRQLDLGTLFTFTQPTRDLSRLCAREGFESPTARIISETGRLSKTPVFVVGVFSGRDELGQAAGASLNEARWKAAARALKGWYLYSPAKSLGAGIGQGVMVPSMTERQKEMAHRWQPAVIDDGEIVV